MECEQQRVQKHVQGQLPLSEIHAVEVVLNVVDPAPLICCTMMMMITIMIVMKEDGDTKHKRKNSDMVLRAGRDADG